VTEGPTLAGTPGDDRDYGARLVAGHGAAMRVLLRAANAPRTTLDLRVELGSPAERLADVAASEQALLIVHGSQGGGSHRSALLGSVSSELARAATQPLVLVPPAAGVGRFDHARERPVQARGVGRPATRRRRSDRPAAMGRASGWAVSKP
jgi:hypothetical protein